jgi:para-aminobenzoate synthetase/4-amino-4-deoxychorismate lyase
MFFLCTVKSVTGVSEIAKIVIKNSFTGRWWLFEQPIAIVVATELSEVLPALQETEKFTRNGFYAAGFLSYEAAPAFDPVMKTHYSAGFPLLYFGIYQQPQVVQLPEMSPDWNLQWQMDTDLKKYRMAIEKIKSAIARGDTYQVNYTIRQFAHFSDDPYQLFFALANHAPFAAFIDLPQFAICSASPELFFTKKGRCLLTRPMKGTAPRGRTLQEDRYWQNFLKQSEKDQAENAMIADMMRNDLGKICRTGSVNVVQPFQIEKYHTVWQMTTGVIGETNSGLTKIFQALFPCASITGAPKIKTMELITKVEDSPRKIYTGNIGFITPEGDAQFNVAIRTALVDKLKKQIEYGIGSGVVWDSQPELEYQECIAKAKVIEKPRMFPKFALLESLRWSPTEAYFLCDLHLERLRDSAIYFDYPFDMQRCRILLERLAKRLPTHPHKVRLLLYKNGGLQISATPIDEPENLQPLWISPAKEPIDTSDPFYYHKTTYRKNYQNCIPVYPGADEIVLFNEAGEVTETRIYNIVAKINGDWITPPVNCGLLPGTYRRYLIEKKLIREGTITLADLQSASEIALINSVRLWRPAILMK